MNGGVSYTFGGVGGPNASRNLGWSIMSDPFRLGRVCTIFCNRLQSGEGKMMKAKSGAEHRRPRPSP